MDDVTAQPLPPCSNTGVERVICRPDWLDVSLRIPGGEDHELKAAHELLQSFAPGPSTVGRGRGFYERLLSSDDASASVAYSGHADAKGTVLLTLPGAWWATAPDPEETARAIYGRDGHVARLDLAADYDGPDVPPVAAIADAIARREWVTRLRSAYEGRDLMTGKRTVYLGSKASERRMRVYDLRGPVRVEIQTRNDVAAQLLESVAASGSVAALRATVTAMVDFPTVRGWAALLAA
jgi:hypothetical protein